MESLLGHYYSRIKGSQEDIASEGLAYILNRSPIASEAVRRMVKNECGIDLPDLLFKTQVSGEKLERPDIIGFDEYAKERLIIEAKFWAALTANQPVEYLKRLSGENNALMFVCPALRVHLLWDELVRLIQIANIEVSLDDKRQVASFSNNCCLFIKTWDQVLSHVKESLLQGEDRSLVSDIDQIIGFCNKIDDIAFMPILQQDLSPSIGKRVYSYYLLVDKIIATLKRKLDVNLSGLKASPQYGGYARYFRVGHLGLSLNLNFKHWYEKSETPFWITIKSINENEWEVTQELTNACKKVESLQKKKLFMIDGVPHFPLFPKLNEPEETVLEDISSDIVSIIKAVLHVNDEFDHRIDVA
jgi:hypothetical protein